MDAAEYTKVAALLPIKTSTVWQTGKAIDKVGADAANLRPPGEGLGFEWM
jgi:hypothetical protein